MRQNTHGYIELHNIKLLPVLIYQKLFNSFKKNPLISNALGQFSVYLLTGIFCNYFKILI